MLHIILDPPFDEVAKKCSHFEIGDSTELINLDTVNSVVADGHELDFIEYHFTGIPMRLKADRANAGSSELSQQWFGDHAKFIVANWT